MSFLAPLFLLGALAVALPVIFHLIRRTTRERLPFSSLMFLHSTPPRVTRRSRLEHLLLLLLRCLVLVLLALGFARPWLQRAATPGAAAAPARLVVLVDTSASMRRSGLWLEALAQLRNTLAQATPADQVAVFAFDREVRRLVTFEQWTAWSAAERARLAAQRVGDLSPGWAETRLDEALIAAAETLEEATRQEEAGGIRRIVVLSDAQEGCRLDRLQGYEWPRGIELTLEPLKARRPTNAGLHLVQERDDAQPPRADAPVRVRVSNSADAQREQFQLAWGQLGGRGVLGPVLDVYVPPGQSRVWSAPKVEGEAERLVLWGDDEEFDNVAFVVPPQGEQLTVVFLGEDDARDPAQCLYYLKRAFQETRRQAVRVLTPAPGLTPGPEVTQAPLVIATDPLSDDRLRLAQQSLRAGHTVLLVMKSPAAALVLTALVGAGPVGAEEAPADRYALLAEIDFGHPLFAPFADPRFSDFTKIHFWKHRRLATNNLPGARVLARFDQGDPALVQVPVGSGTLLAWTAGWHPADSQLALSSKFVPLLYSLLEMSGAGRPRPAHYVVGDRVPSPAELARGAPPLTVRKPDGTRLSLAGGAGAFAETDQPGIYTVSQGTATYRFAVNLAPEESKTAPLPLEELEKRGVPLKIPSELAAKQAAERLALLQAAELESRQKLWRWLLLAALVALLAETALAGRFARRMTPAEAPAAG